VTTSTDLFTAEVYFSSDKKNKPNDPFKILSYITKPFLAIGGSHEKYKQDLRTSISVRRLFRTYDYGYYLE
jgi:hypothetical protein